VLVPVEQERRLAKRKTLERLTYIDLPSHNGGIVTDVSEGGLGFHAIAPVENGAPIHFWFSGGSQRIAGVGELTWTDGKKKVGGLRFTSLPEDIRQQIRNWPLETNLRFGAVKAAAPDQPAAPGPPVANGPVAASSTPEATPRAIAAVSEAPPKSPQRPGANLGQSSYAPYFPEVVSSKPQPGTRSSRLVKAMGMFSLAGFVGVASYLCFLEVREWLAASRQSAQRQQISQELARVSAAKSTSEIALAGHATAGGAAPGAPQALAASAPAAHAPATPETPPAAGEKIFVQVAAYTKQADEIGRAHV
jgi:hypothetical protein